MKVQVVTPSLDKNAGGVAPAVLSLYDNYTKRFQDTKIEYLALAAEADAVDVKVFQRLNPGSLGLSLQLLSYINKSECDIVHHHGMWMMTSLYPLLSSFKKSRSTVISPHGMMDPWIMNNNKSKKMIAKCLYEYWNWKRCSVFHALTDTEADAIKKYAGNVKIEVIPNGIQVNPNNDPSLNPKKFNEIRRVLYLGRIDKKKNIHSLVKAVQSISQADYEKRPFVVDIVGWGDQQYVEKIQKMISQSSSERFCWHGPKFGKEKEEMYKNSDLFILPSLSEGLPMSILEAWSYGVPVLMTRECNLIGAFVENVAFEIGANSLSISDSILDVLKMTDRELSSFARLSYDYVKRFYCWGGISNDFQCLYQGLASEY